MFYNYTKEEFRFMWFRNHTSFLVRDGCRFLIGCFHFTIRRFLDFRFVPVEFDLPFSVLNIANFQAPLSKVLTTTKTLPPSFWLFRRFYPAQQADSFLISAMIQSN